MTRFRLMLLLLGQALFWLLIIAAVTYQFEGVTP